MKGYRYRQKQPNRTASVLLLCSIVLSGTAVYMTATDNLEKSTVPQSQQQAADSMTPMNGVPLKFEKQQELEVNLDQTPYLLFEDHLLIGAYADFASAVDEAKLHPEAEIHFKHNSLPIWSYLEPSGEAHVEAPLIYQMPELERGCEVTSLAMLLQHAGVEVDKMTLAEEILKDPTPFELYDHMIHFGNPNTGFVGDMESFGEPGYGVYHGPVAQLAEKYLPGRVIDATGATFDDLLLFLDQGVPLWVIVNMDYQALDEDGFETWETPLGGIDITYREHSVLVTGYDADAIYFNDPLGEQELANRDDFVAAWEQMGRQAVTYAKNGQES